ncbi:MAG: diaminobutyrate acetyltransferase [Planctomycetales bacterium]|nr:diaminobutyrate acetyltransferase [Planctomycetales bacterium]
MPADNLSKATRTFDIGALAFRTPTLQDAAQMWQLASDSGVLDENSHYCYLIICRDFSETCVVAADGSEIVGFVTAYRPPQRSSNIFVWQIGVSEAARGRGVAKRLLHELVALPACRGVQVLEATVTPSNSASRRLFQSFAANLSVPCNIAAGFARELFSDGEHEEEELLRVGPFA